MNDHSPEHFTEELYFLIIKFLESGPCKQSLEKLKDEVFKHQIIPKRLDWEGETHDQTFEELERRYPHIAPQHLLEVCKRICPLVDKDAPPCAPGVKTLLGAGSLSLLRSKADYVKKALRLSEYIARRHGRSLYSPVSCRNHNIVQVLTGQEISGPASVRHLMPPKFYTRMQLLNRTLGHLTAVYCLLFDQSGKFIITGADDLLVKVWSATDHKLLCTFRGASAEITDIAINIENTLVAAGSLDKSIRVWSLQTSYPVATLSAHNGMITGVNFCPNAFNGTHYLVSTSSDGSVAFWPYSTQPVIFQTKPVMYNERIRPGQAQMICSSFSPGGAFLATGSADHNVRVYSMSDNPPHRIMETEKHSDRVDSLLWANKSLKFVSGSKDGTSIIWKYKAQNWQTTLLDMSTTLPGSKVKEDEAKLKLKVTMVCWTADDSCVITAVNNGVIKVWTPVGELLREFTSHKDVVYCLEYHPYISSILMSAGHDGNVFLWDVRTGEEIFMYQNYIEGQGNSAIFDAKWSPDGTMMAATDSHGHLLLFGLAAYNNKIKELPKEMFFHTDYRPLVRDNLNQVLDEETQIPPHLMPPPFLVDMNGSPYQPHLQRLVPGRENCTLDQLVPDIIYTSGGPEVVQFFNSNARSNIEQRIEELVQTINSSTNANEPSAPRVLRRREVEGRNSAGNEDFENFSWEKRILVSPLSLGTLDKMVSRVKVIGELEIEEYEREKRREIQIIQEVLPVRSKKPKRKLNHNYRTRATREAQQPASDGEESVSAGSEANLSESSGLSEEIGSSSESSSSEYSDWVADQGVNLEPPKRSRRQRKLPPPQQAAGPSHEPTPKKSGNLLNSSSSSSLSQGSPSVPAQLPHVPSKKAPPLPSTEIKEIPEEYRPSEWLSEVIPKKFPYYPQMGDEVMFFAQGYSLYLNAVTNRNVYQVAKSQLRPWGNLTLREPELVKVIGIKYELRPPRLCCLRLAVMRENGVLTGDRFTIKYHDLPDVIDFFVLKQTYDTAMTRNWKIGDRFRSMIDNSWWWGVIESRRPQSDSAFLCHRIKWDNGETEDMSPWDMEPIDPSREPPEKGGSMPVLQEEIAATLYHPRSDDWPGGDRESSCRRIITCLEELMGLSIAEPFLAPVDISVYKSYVFVVEYPIDLSTMKARFENQFYRRLTAAQFDIRYLATNAEKYNETHSVIVKNARIITDLCLKICKENGLVDIPQLYRQFLESYESSNSDNEEGKEPTNSKRERAAANRSLRAMRRANTHQLPDWRRDCRQLLEVLWNCPDSEPFRKPVDRIENPDYHKIILRPIDLGEIREELRGNNYDSPLEFCKDIRLMFSNSRSYNTNKRSKIYVMTVRLAALAEEHMKQIIRDWKSACQKERMSKKMNGLRRKHVRKSGGKYENESDEESSTGKISDLSIDDSPPPPPPNNRNLTTGLRRRPVRKPKTLYSDEESGEERSSDSSKKEEPPPSTRIIINQGLPKRVKVLLPKIREDKVSTSSSSAHQRESTMENQSSSSRNSNGYLKSRLVPPDEDSLDQARRPSRLRIFLNKGNSRFLSTSEDSSSLPSTSNSGFRSLRATKAVSYARMCGGGSSSSEDDTKDHVIRKALPYNIRRGGSSQNGPTAVNYQEPESEESADGNENTRGTIEEHEEVTQSSVSSKKKCEDSSNSDDNDLEQVEMGSGDEGIEITINCHNNNSNSTSSLGVTGFQNSTEEPKVKVEYIEQNEEEDVEEVGDEENDQEEQLDGGDEDNYQEEQLIEEEVVEDDYQEEQLVEEEVDEDNYQEEQLVEEEGESVEDEFTPVEDDDKNDEDFTVEDDEYEDEPSTILKQGLHQRSRKRKKSTDTDVSGTSGEWAQRLGRSKRPRKRPHYPYSSDNDSEEERVGSRTRRRPSWKGNEQTRRTVQRQVSRAVYKSEVSEEEEEEEDNDHDWRERPSGSQRRSSRRKTSRKRESSLSETERRSANRRTGRVRYNMDNPSSEESPNEKPKISISSRGRVRKITPKARAFLLD